jgi:replicative DNA helicase
MNLPHSLEAERAVIGRIMASGHKIAGEVIGTKLEPDHFYIPAHKVIYSAIYDAYYADEPVEPLAIGDGCAKRLAKVWSCDEQDAVVRVRELATGQTFTGSIIDHAKVVKKKWDLRRILELAAHMQEEVAAEAKSPEEIAGAASQNAMRIATSTLLTHELIEFGDLGRRFIARAKLLRKAREEGVELGAYTGLKFIDQYTRGIQPTELVIGGGEPGVGKSAIWWKAAMGFAERQMSKPPDQRIAAFILSLEMSEPPSSDRIAASVASLDGGRLREGDIDERMMQAIIYEWGRRKDIPLIFNFTSMLRASQMRALIVEAIRKYNVGFVVIDHFRYFDLDERIPSQIQEDEEKARFLKESIAKDLNVAVVCLAHTTKGIENQPDRRPNLSHLRGSGQVAAHADFVNFMYRPYTYATDEQKAHGEITETDAELIWRKNRHGLDGIAPFHFEPSIMAIR